MGINNSSVGEPEATATEFQGSCKSTGFGDVKNSIADTLKNIAEALGEKAAGEDGRQSGMAQCGKQASEWLGQSAEYVRQFDYEQEDAKVREYVRQNPGRSLLIAGGIGLLIGSLLRRR